MPNLQTNLPSQTELLAGPAPPGVGHVSTCPSFCEFSPDALNAWARRLGHVDTCLTLQSQQFAGVVAEHFRSHVRRQVDLGEQLELRHVLAGVQKVGAEHQPVSPADEELSTELLIAADRAGAAAGREIAVDVLILLHQPVDRSPGRDGAARITAEVLLRD